MKLTEIAKTIVRHVLIYGPPKVGKTRLAGTLAKKYKLLWFDLENGHETLLQLPLEYQENIDVIQIPDTRDFPIAIETMLKVIRGDRVRICATHGKVTCALCMKEQKPLQEVCLKDLDPNEWIVVVDSGTQLTASAIAHITKGKEDLYKMQTDDWGNLGKLMEIFYSHVQNAPFHIVVISHQTDVEKEENKPSKFVPSAGSRNFASQVARFFGEVIYCEVRNASHTAGSSTTYVPNVLTGSRSGVKLEKNGTLDLLDIFDPDRPREIMEETPASQSLSAMDKLRQNLNKGTAK